MDRQRWNRVQALFDAAADKAPSEQATFLRMACAGDDELYREVASLLEADAASNDPDALLRGHAADALDVSVDSFLNAAFGSEEGQQVGPWRLVRRLGEGGMGAVYLAERVEGGFRQHAALKLLKRGMDTRDVLRRFESERQILARLHHPNIARLLDGGLTSEGLPYYAMEYVEGEPLDTYCHRHTLDLNARLHLFMTVCEAVQYAHQNLVVHRDLKPSNILVDAQGKPKLLDFGIAKVLAIADDGEARARTHSGTRVMTPEYASPEQIRSQPITTATDVYSLGVIFYELMTGRRPYNLKSHSLLEIEAAICFAVPEPPSTVVMEKTTRLYHRFAGDLDAISLKALEKAPGNRYLSPERFADDIRRHLRGLPVAARRHTARYRTAKFIKRHRTGAATTLAVLLLVAALVGFYTVELSRERDRAMTEAEKAAHVSAFFQSLFTMPGPDGEPLSLHEALQRGAIQIEQEMAGQPDVQAALMDVLGSVYSNLGEYDDARPLLEKALRLRREAHSDAPTVGLALAALGRLEYAAGNPSEATLRFREAIATYETAGDVARTDLAVVLTDWARLLLEQGDPVEAEALLRRALALRRTTLSDAHPDVAATLRSLARLHDEQGDPVTADSLLREALRLQQTHQEASPEMASTLAELATARWHQQRLAEAEMGYREALDMQRTLLGESHPDIAATLMQLGQLQQAQRHYEEAEAALQESLEIRRRTLGSSNPATAGSMNALGLLALERGAHDTARDHFLNALDALRQSEAAPLEQGITLHHLATALETQGRYVEAETRWNESLTLLRSSLRPDHAALAQPLIGLGRLLTSQGNPQGAEPLLHEALALRSHGRPAGHPDVAEAQAALGACLLAQGAFNEAEALLQSALGPLRGTLGVAHPQTQAVLRDLVALYQASGRPDGAATFAAQIRPSAR